MAHMDRTPASINTQQRHQPPQPPQQHQQQDHWLTGGSYQPYPDHDPYQTPRLQQDRTPQMAQQVIGQPAPSTRPARPSRALYPEMPALNAQTLIMARERCWRCEGAGIIEGEYTVCGICGHEWGREQTRQGIRSTLLPCGHGARNRDIVYQPANCPTCHKSPAGTGYLPRSISLGEFVSYLLHNTGYLNGLLDVIEHVYGWDESSSTTESAERRAVLASQIPSQLRTADTQPATPAQQATNQPVQLTPTMLPPLAPKPQPPDDMPSRF